MKRRELHELIDLPIASYDVRLNSPPTQCECCHTRISRRFYVVGADGRRAMLGGDCFVRATAAICDPALADKVRKLAKAAARLAKRLKERAEGKPVGSRQAIIDVELLLAVAPDLGTNIPHPLRPVGTARDYLKFGITNAKKKETRQRIAGYGEKLFLARDAQSKGDEE